MDDRVMPHHPDIEKAALGACMLGGITVLESVRAKVPPEGFYHTHHRLIYSALLRLASQGKPLDQTAVVMALEASKDLERINGPATVAHIASEVATASGAEYHAAIIAEDYAKRRIIVEAEKLAHLAYDPGTEAAEVCAATEKRLRDIIPAGNNVWTDEASGMQEAKDAVDYAVKHPGTLLGVSTGIPKLDDTLGGLQRGALILVAARPSMGKTSFGLHIARSCRVPCAFVSAEMGRRALQMRLLAARADVDSHVMRTGRLSVTAQEKIAKIQGSPSLFLTSMLQRPSEIVAHVRQLQKQKSCGLLIIDYLQLLRPDSIEQNREREVASIGDALKDAAIRLDIPVVAMVQLSRAPEHRPEKRPALSDLRDSGTLEQTADIVAFLYREEYYEPEKAKENGHENLCQIIIGKHRDGPIGTIKTYFDRTSGVWREWNEPHSVTITPQPPMVYEPKNTTAPGTSPDPARYQRDRKSSENINLPF